MQEYIEKQGGGLRRIGFTYKDAKLGIVPSAAIPSGRDRNDRAIWVHHNGLSAKFSRFSGLVKHGPPIGNKYKPMYPAYDNCAPAPELEPEKRDRCQFEETFPRGIETIETSGERLMCGWNSIVSLIYAATPQSFNVTLHKIPRRQPHWHCYSCFCIRLLIYNSI